MARRSSIAAGPRLPRTGRLTLTLVCRRTPAHDHDQIMAAVVSQPPHRRRQYDHAAALATFGAHRGELQRVCRAAERLGFTVTDRDARTRLVTVRGSVATIERAFGVELRQLDTARGRRRGHGTPYAVPPSMSGLVEAVLGLDDIPLARPAAAARAPRAATTLLPQQLAEHYRFPAADGTGERIALLQLGGGFRPADLQAYFARLALKRPPPTTSGPNRPVGRATLRHLVSWMNGTGPHAPALDAPAARWTFETTMDIEIAAALAPGAAVDVHFAHDDAARGIVTALRAIVHARRRPSVLSCSWDLGAAGDLATSSGRGTKSPLALIEDALHEAAALGVTVCAASGDDGSTRDGAKGGPLGVVYPASSAAVLAVGGTSVEVVAGRPSGERVWNAKEAGLSFATGGGLARHPAGAGAGPPAWQRTTLARWLAGDPPGAVPLASIARGVPDVAANADFGSGCLLIVGGLDTRAGGTSAAAPLWAALVARLNGALRGKAGHTLGLLTPSLYTPSAARTFTSIHEGHNNLKDVRGPYQAARSWDPCTGLGVPDGERLLAVLKSARGE
jgi:kumamolisin